MSKPTVLVMLTMLIAACNGSRVNRHRVSSQSTEENKRTIEDAIDKEGIDESAEENSGEEEGLDEEDGEANATSMLGCTNYCVQCNDGSSVWYGRDRNWFKAGATTVVGAIGASGGLFAGAVAAGAGAAPGTVLKSEHPEETHTHWSGALPTTGLFCEKVDIIKFSKALSCSSQYFMEKSTKWVGRVKNNKLKPYNTKGKLVTSTYVPGDMKAYKDGCKVVKAAGTRKWQQLSFGPVCTSGTTKGIHKCSAHSMLCGAAGVAGTTHAANADQCKSDCEHGNTHFHLKCRVKGPANGNGYNNQQYNPGGYQQPVTPGYQQPVTPGYQQPVTPGYQQPAPYGNQPYAQPQQPYGNQPNYGGYTQPSYGGYNPNP